MISLTRLTKPRQKINLLLASIFMALQLPFALLAITPVSADHEEGHESTGSTGNNGTLKIHELGTPSGAESNDPKVCAFRFEGFQFDAQQSGYVIVEPQGNDTATTDSAQLDFGPTDNDGYAATVYLNNGTDTEQLDNGHYKATLYGKDTGGEINLEDEKAKSKNFKIECEVAEVLGSITIIKDAQPNNIQDFIFTATGLTGTSGFTLDDDGETAAVSNQRVFDELDAGEYSFTETPTEGWTLASITCDTNEGVTVAIPKVTIALAEGDDVSCTFVNTINQTTRGRVLSEDITVTEQVATGAVLGAQTGSVLGAQTNAPVGGVSAGYGGVAQAGASLGSLAGLATSLSALGYGVAASLRKRQ